MSKQRIFTLMSLMWAFVVTAAAQSTPLGKWNLYDAGIRVPLIAAWPGVIKPNSVSDAMVQWMDLLPTLIDAAGGGSGRP